MNKYERIISIENEWQAQLIDEELKQRNIPHIMRSHRDSALDGIFQSGGGWGHIEAPQEFKDEISAIVEDLRNRPPVEAGDSESSEEEMGKEDGKSKWRTVSIVLLIASIAVGSWALRNWYVRSCYVETIGRVLYVKTQATTIQNNANLEHPSTTSVYNSHVLVEYLVDGKKVRGEVDVGSARIREGDRLRVLYSRTQPSHCMLK